MLSKVISCQRAQENMYVEGSQPRVHFHRDLKKGGCWQEQRHLKRLRPLATAPPHTHTLKHLVQTCLVKKKTGRGG